MPRLSTPFCRQVVVFALLLLPWLGGCSEPLQHLLRRQQTPALLFGPLSQQSRYEQILTQLWVRSAEPERELHYDRWALQSEESASPAISKDGRFLFVGSEEQRITCFLAATGKIRWSKNLLGRVVSTPHLHNETLYMGTTGGLIYALRQSDGKEIWKYQAEGEVLSTMQYAPASKENPPSLLLTTGNNQLYALHAETGALLWRYKHESSTGILLSVRGQCPPTLHQDKVYTGFSDGTLGAFQLSDGSVVWKIRLQEGERFTDIDAPIVILREYLYAVSYNSGLFALRLKDGKQLWKYKIQGASSPYIREDELFLSNIHGKIVSLHAFSGRKRWEKQYKRAGALSRIVGTYNYLFVSGNQYGLYVLHRKDGRVAQILRASRGVTAAPLLWGQRLFLFANTSFVYAFSTGLESRLKFSKDF